MTDAQTIEPPAFSDVEAAAARIAPFAQKTPLRRSASIDALAGAELVFKCENLQRVGAFKFRGACNAVWALADDVAARGVVTHSSGNHGAALALAARTRGIPAHVVVPVGAVRSKLAAIVAAGATLHRCEATMTAREEEAERVRAASGATLVHPFADRNVIAGQGTATLELVREAGALDAIVAPIGGGGLVGGAAIVAGALVPDADVFGAEPAGADDAARSLARGERVAAIVPDTICDGLRGVIGAVNFEILKRCGVAVLTVEDRDTIAAMRLAFERLKLVVEPSAAIALAAILANRERFEGRRVGVILSGGNVDLDALPW